MKIKMLAPGERRGNRFWMFRCTIDGHRTEVSTGEVDREAADRFVTLFLEAWPIYTARHARVHPQPIAATPLNDHLARSFVLDAEGRPAWPDGRPLKGYRAAGGYIQIDIIHDGIRRRVMEHRLVFLLAHGWLPESVDHINGVRDDNRPANLRASTPYLQQRNRREHREAAKAGQRLPWPKPPTTRKK